MKIRFLNTNMKKECCDINEVVQEFYDFLKFYILKKVNDEVIAEDIVQEVMIKLIESHQKDIQVKNIKAWLFQVSRNTIYDYFKNNKLNHLLEYNNTLVDNENNLFELSVHDFIIPMIQFLPKKYAEPLYWSDIDNIPQNVIAERLGLSHSGAKMRVQRARVKLRELSVECCNIEYDAEGNFATCTVKDSCTPLKNHLTKYKKENNL